MKTTALRAFALLAPAPVALAQNVGIRGSLLGCNYTDVNAALAAANPGDTVYMKAGHTFNESVTVDFDVTLAAGNTTCSAAASGTFTHPVLSGYSAVTPLVVINNAD